MLLLEGLWHSYPQENIATSIRSSLEAVLTEAAKSHGG